MAEELQRKRRISPARRSLTAGDTCQQHRLAAKRANVRSRQDEVSSQAVSRTSLIFIGFLSASLSTALYHVVVLLNMLFFPSQRGEPFHPIEVKTLGLLSEGELSL